MINSIQNISLDNNKFINNSYKRKNKDNIIIKKNINLKNYKEYKDTFDVSFSGKFLKRQPKNKLFSIIVEFFKNIVSNKNLKKTVKPVKDANEFITYKDILDQNINRHTLTLDNFAKDVFSTAGKGNKISTKDKLRIMAKFNILVHDIVCEKNFINNGTNAAIYRVNDDLVLKIPLCSQKIQSVKPKDIEFTTMKYKNLKQYFGEDIMTVNYDELQFKKNVGKHIPAGVPLNIRSEDVEKYFREVYLPMFSKVSQNSYDDVARDFAMLNKYKSNNLYSYLSVDFNNPSNIVLANGKLYIVDEIENTALPNSNNFVSMLQLLLYNRGDISNVGNHVKEAREIFHKVALAAEKHNLPFGVDWDTSEILDTVLDLCQARVNYSQFEKEVKLINNTTRNVNQRLQELSTYLNEIMPLK